MNIIKKYVLVVWLALTAGFYSTRVHADDILKGVKGPTNLQIDYRVSLSKNEKNIETIANDVILKYWDGDKFGKWGFVNTPFKYIDSSSGSDKGLSDISVGFGPRGRIDNFHWLSYLAFTFPTGDSEGEIQLGNGRLDTKIGLIPTYLFNNGTYEIDSLLEYNFTGENKKGINPPNVVYGGLLFGRKITDKLRLAIGFTDLIKENGDYSLSSRSVLRHTFSSTLHLELVGDIGVKSKNMPQSNSLGIYIRYNF